MNTKQIALDRQQAVGPPCSIGAPWQPSAFQPFPSPSGLPHPTLTGPDSGGSDPHERPGAALEQSLGVPNGEGTTQQHQRETSDALAAMDAQQQQQASGQAGQSGGQGRASVHGPDRPEAGPSDVAPGSVDGAASSGGLEGADDRATAEQFRDMGGDAWKVFYMASRMGVRPDVLEKAAKRMRSLQQHSD